MQVRHILSGKGGNIVTARPDSTIAEAAKLLKEKNIGAIVITDARQSVVGIISERDIVRALANNGASILDQPVSSFMTQSVVTCAEHESVHDLMAKMTSGRFRHLPVVADTRLAGIVSIGDVVKTRIAEVQREAEALRDYISSN